MIRTAVFSPCRRYRYSLTRIWGGDADPANVLAFIGLNPSTADESVDDPTIRREMAFAQRHGYKGLVKFNAYAWRATDPRDLHLAPDPVGPENDSILGDAAVRYPRLVLAWGANIDPDRSRRILDLLCSYGAVFACLGRTSAGHPRHPLYLRSDTPLETFTP